MLEVKGLWFKHKRSEEILKGINFTADVGMITSILGRNGSGKTTLFKCILGIWRPEKGVVCVKGKNTTHLPFKEKASIFSFVPQEHAPSFSYSVFDVVLMGRAFNIGIFSSPSKRDKKIVEEALELVGIEKIKYRPYTEISGGERQLVLIARALVQNSSVMLLDEPTSHLDFKNQIGVLEKIKEIAKRKHMIVVITLHDPNLASIFSDRIVLLHKGKVVASGEPKHIITKTNIRQIYQLDVCLVNINGDRMIYPKSIPSRRKQGEDNSYCMASLL